MCVGAFVFYMFVVTDSLWNDTYATSLSRVAGILGVVLFTLTLVLRICQSCLAGQEATVSEKFAATASMACPSLKYHIFRLNNKFEGEFRRLFNIDVSCNIMQIIVGILVEIAAGNALRLRFIDNSGYPIYDHDFYYMQWGIFLLVESLFLWPLSVLTHGKWISQINKDERQRAQMQHVMHYRFNGPYGP